MTRAPVKRRVLFVAPSAYPLGGVAVWLDYLVPGLAPLGWEATAGLVGGRFHDVAAYRSWYPGLPVAEVHSPTGSQEGRVRALTALITRLSPDVIVGVNIVDAYMAAQRVRRRGQTIRIVMALHGIAVDLLEDLRREASTIDAVIATNQLACRLCAEYSGFPAERVLYAPYGVDVPHLQNLARKPPSGPLRIAWVGRLEQPQKRVHDIAAILSKLDQVSANYHVRIAGDGPDREQLLKSLAPWTENGRLDYLGALQPVALQQEIYASSDVLLVTSSWETGPIVVWEAMAAGLAIVTSAYVGSGLESALAHERNCLMFPVGETSEAARLLAELDSNPTLRHELAVAGQQLVAERYAKEHSTTSWRDCLEVVMRLPPRPPCAGVVRSRRAGRLDKLLGTWHAETLRACLGISHPHHEPGGEWPHSAASNAGTDGLLRMATELDRFTA